MNKMYENLLIKLNNAAKARKESMAIENGFETAADFKAFLKSKIEAVVTDKETKKESVEELTDLVIAFDTTSSMGSYIGDVKKHVQELIPESFRDNKNLNISIVAFGDYCDMQSSSKFGKAYQVINLTNDQNALINFVRNAQNTSGGDGDEFYELVIKKIVEETTWRTNSSKSILFIGDDGPHPVGYTYPSIVQNAQIDWKKECEKAASLNIKIDTLSIRGNKFYNKVAELTGGLCLPFNKSEKTSQLVKATVLARGGKSTRSAFHSMSVSSAVTTDADMNNVYTMYKTVVKK
jgi:hypothetical protein